MEAIASRDGFETERKRRTGSHPFPQALRGDAQPIADPDVDSRLSASEGPNPTLDVSFWGQRPQRAGGEGGIRTHGSLSTTTAFEAGRFNHSRTSPRSVRLKTADHTVPRLTEDRRGQVECSSPRDRSCVNPGLRATMRALNPARPGREQRLGEALGDAVGSGFTHGRIDTHGLSTGTPENTHPR